MKKKKEMGERYKKLERFLNDEKMKKAYIIYKLIDEYIFEEGATSNQLRKRVNHIRNDVERLLNELVKDGWLIAKQELVYYINEEKVEEMAEFLAKYVGDLEEIDNMVPLTFTTKCFPHLSAGDMLRILTLIKRLENL